MNLKPGISIRGIRPEVVLALSVAREVFMNVGAELTITSCTEGRHSRGSRHYTGLAADLRTRHLPHAKLEQIVPLLKQKLGAEFDVVLEADHIHIEYDPKEPA